MRAMIEHEGRLGWSEVEEPSPGPGEVRIRIAATAVNRADLVQRSGHYAPPPGASAILGLECAGVIDALGDGVNEGCIEATGFLGEEPLWVGQEVCALLAGGGYAEKVVLPASHVLPIPKGLSMVEAAALPEVWTTAWLNLRQEGELVAGERVLVHAGASGVGTAALQLCHVWGCPVFATVGSAAKELVCRQYGADATANRKDGPWLEKVRAWGEVSVILDPIGGAYLQDNIAVLASKGRLVHIGLMGGSVGVLPLSRVLMKRLTLRGSVLRSRSVKEKASILAAMRQEIWPLFESGRLRPVISQAIDLSDAEEAHRLVASNETIGKVVLTVTG